MVRSLTWLLLTSLSGGCGWVDQPFKLLSSNQSLALRAQEPDPAAPTIELVKVNQKTNSLLQRFREQYREGDLRRAQKTLNEVRKRDPYCQTVYELQRTFRRLIPVSRCEATAFSFF